MVNEGVSSFNANLQLTAKFYFRIFFASYNGTDMGLVGINNTVIYPPSSGAVHFLLLLIYSKEHHQVFLLLSRQRQFFVGNQKSVYMSQVSPKVAYLLPVRLVYLLACFFLFLAAFKKFFLASSLYVLTFVSP